MEGVGISETSVALPTFEVYKDRNTGSAINYQESPISAETFQVGNAGGVEGVMVVFGVG
jgi:hypothetical protein